MMMALGQFVFSLSTLAYQDLSRQTQWRHASNSRVGVLSARQFTGPGDETLALSGLLAPEFMGSTAHIKELRRMADTGEAFALVDRIGKVYGAWVIESINEKESIFMDNGAARRIEFDMQLARVDDNRASGDGGTGGGGTTAPDPDDAWMWWL